MKRIPALQPRAQRGGKSGVFAGYLVDKLIVGEAAILDAHGFAQ
jgi:hypothetical protein